MTLPFSESCGGGGGWGLASRPGTAAAGSGPVWNAGAGCAPGLLWKLAAGARRPEGSGRLEQRGQRADPDVRRGAGAAAGRPGGRRVGGLSWADVVGLQAGGEDCSRPS